MKEYMEEYMEDIREKAITARSTHSRVTHGRKVRLNCDGMTRKELEKMNGTCETYDLNKPMSWAEFKAMPDDIKVMYIDRIREKFGDVPTKQVSYMMACSDALLSRELKRIGVKPVCKFGSGSGMRVVYDKNAFYTWAGIGNQAEALEEPEEPKAEPAPEAAPAAEAEPESVAGVIPAGAIPRSGELTFEGQASDICMNLWSILGSQRVRMTVSFEKVGEANG